MVGAARQGTGIREVTNVDTPPIYDIREKAQKFLGDLNVALLNVLELGVLVNCRGRLFSK